MVSDQEYINLIREKLSEKRYIHSLEVAKEARRLAGRYGCDENKAYTAGLLHDLAKDMPVSETLQLLDGFDIILTDIERLEHKLLHAIAGAAYMKNTLGIDDEDLLNAVRYHTTARAKMSLLEKTLYLADFTSVDREYEGVENMRRAVERGISAAMEQALIFTLSDLLEKGAAIHPDTLDAYNEMILGNDT